MTKKQKMVEDLKGLIKNYDFASHNAYEHCFHTNVKISKGTIDAYYAQSNKTMKLQTRMAQIVLGTSKETLPELSQLWEEICEETENWRKFTWMF